MALIPEWRKAWRMTSVQIAVLIAAVNAAAIGWSAFQGLVNPIVFASVNLGLGVAVAVARVIPQAKLREPPDQQ
jgi:type IV secretory pathway TrbF-like protein